MSALATYNYTAVVENGVTIGYSVTCTNKTTATYAVIPDTYEGLPVIKIDENAFYNSTVRVVEIPASIQEIGNNALRLKSVIYTERVVRFHSTTPPTFRSTLTYVDKIQVPSSSIDTYKSTLYYSSIVEKIEALPVYATYSYTSITTEGSITGYSVRGANKSANPTVAIIPETYNGLPVKVIADNAFTSWSSLTDVVIQGNVVRVGKNAFDNTLQLVNLVIGDNVTAIDDYAFRGKNVYASSRFALYIPKSVVTIGKRAFAYRYALSSITFEKPSSLTTIGERAFYNCNAIKEIDLPDSLESIGRAAFLQSETSYSYTVAGSLKTVTIGANLQSVGGGAFECATLTRVNYRGTLDTWCGIQFEGTSHIGDIQFSNGIANPLYYTHNLYRTWMVSGVDRYENITTGDITINAPTINQNVLIYCTNITSITLTSTVTNIYEGAFLGCVGLQYVKIQNVTPPTLHSTTAFNDTNDCIIYVPEISLNTYAAAPNWSDLYALDRLQAYTVVAEFMYTEVYNDDDELIGYAVACSNISEQPYIAQIPSQYNEYPVLSIVENAFLNCAGMSTLTVPSTIVNIDENAFSGCTSLTRIVYDGTIYDWINIDFANEYSNPVTLGHLLVCKDITPTKVFINDVSTIKNYAFSGNSTIESVIIESVLTNIGDKAFANCSNITDITLVNEIPPTLGNDAFENLPASAKLYVSSRAYTNYTTIWPELTSSISIDDIRISFILNANTVKELFVKKTKYLEDMLTKVDKTTTIAGIDLQDNITANELKNALNVSSTLSGSSVPTTATAGALGQVYIDTTNKIPYMCVDIDNGTYTWVAIAAVSLDYSSTN